MDTVSKLEQVLYDADQILERALLITPGAPFHMKAESEYAQLIIDGDKARLDWPEYTCDYYGGGYLENQSVSFPSALLLMSIEEIKLWKEAQEKEHRDKVNSESAAAQLRYSKEQVARELAAYALLKIKYGP